MIRLGLAYAPADPRQREMAAALAAHAPADFAVDGAPDARARSHDVVLDLDPDGTAMRAAAPGRRVVAWRRPWPDGLERVHAAYGGADGMLFQCAVYHAMLGPLPRTAAAPRGYDPDVFRATCPPARRPLDVLWMGSGGGCALGPRSAMLEHPATALERLGLSCRVLPAAWAAESADRAAQYNAARLVVCADGSGPTDADLLEAAASGCAVITTPAVPAPAWLSDGAHGHRVAPSLAALGETIREALDTRATDPQAAVADMTWRDRAAPIFARLRGEPAAAPPRDLRDQVTAFVTTVGAPSYEACRVHLAQQDCVVRVETIAHVAPMSAAFQRMHDACTTPYYVQVDEDMLLHPHAVRALHERIAAAPPSVAVVVGWLHDVHLARPIQGVKIYRHAAVRRYPYHDVRGCEIDQLRRMAADGLTHEVLRWDDGAPEVLGLHGTHWTPRGIYERFYTLERARRRYPRNLRWLEAWPAILTERVLERRTPLDFYALMGLVAGALAPPEGAGHEKDFRAYDRLPGFDAAHAFWERGDGERP
jgi:hypothetical protein